jgi:hypothetical protein
MGRVALLAILATLTVAPLAHGEALVPLNGPWGAGNPIYATAPPGDGRLFVVERGGGIRVVKDGVLQSTPFLTVPNVATVGERGLLSMAFAPDYATSGKFYVFTVANGADALDPSGAVGDIRIVEYTVSSNPDVADPASARLVLKQPHSATNHNGGQMAFGPDNDLYFTIGDNAQSANAQSLSNLLGKVSRIDPRGATPYAVPSDNPFASTVGARPEIYAFGLRNPFRFSFDRVNGRLVIGDVGEGTTEEVDLGAIGANYGWPTCEGPCANPGFTNPVFSYPHSGGATTQTGCAVIGGFVVRDPTLTALNGRYLYGDLCRTDLRTLNLDAAGADPQPANLAVNGASTLFSFGEDSRSCVYVVADSKLYRVAATAGDPFACPNPVTPRFGQPSPGNPTPNPPATGGGGGTGTSGGGGSTGGGTTSANGTTATLGASPVDTTAPSLRGSRLTSRRLGRTLAIEVRCDEDCDLVASGTFGFTRARTAASRRLHGSRAHATGGQPATLRVTLSRKQLAGAKRALRRHRRVAVRVAVAARDAAGNASHTTLRRTYSAA